VIKLPFSRGKSQRNDVPEMLCIIITRQGYLAHEAGETSVAWSFCKDSNSLFDGIKFPAFQPPNPCVDAGNTKHKNLLII
jgi:hypothetical protein